MAIRNLLFFILMFFSINGILAQVNDIQKFNKENNNLSGLNHKFFISDTATKKYLKLLKKLKENPIFYDINHQLSNQAIINKKISDNEFVPINKADGNRAQLVKIKNPLGVGEPIVNAIRVGDKVIFQGDILLDLNSIVTDTSEAVFSDFVKNINSNFWLDGIIPYAFSTSIDDIMKRKIDSAINEINAKTKLKLRQKEISDKSYLVFYLTNDGCYSDYVGMSGENSNHNKIYISRQCEVGNIMHEILHVAGAFHEHCRRDRDSYVSIDKSNIESLYQDQFDVVNESAISTYPYDIFSIMHYSTKSFAKDKSKRTIIPRNLSSLDEEKIGQRDSLTVGDINGANYLATRKVSPTIIKVPSIHTGELCFKNNGNGMADRDFNGGPKIEVKCSLKFAENNTSIIAEVIVNLTENIDESNPTKGRVIYTKNIFVCPDSFKIIGFKDTVTNNDIKMNVDEINNVNYIKETGTNAKKQYLPFFCKEGKLLEYKRDEKKNFIKSIRLIADTPFRDITDDNNCKCDSKILDIEFHPFMVIMKRIK